MPTTLPTTLPSIDPSGGWLIIAGVFVLGFLILVTRTKRPVTQPVPVVQTGAGQAAVVGVLVEQPAPDTIEGAIALGDTAMGQLAASWKAIKASYNAIVQTNKTLTGERDNLRASLDAAQATNLDLSQRLAAKDEAMQKLDERTMAAEAKALDTIDLAAVEEIIKSGSPPRGDPTQPAAGSTSTVPDAPVEDGPPPAAPTSAQ